MGIEEGERGGRLGGRKRNTAQDRVRCANNVGFIAISSESRCKIGSPLIRASERRGLWRAG